MTAEDYEQRLSAAIEGRLEAERAATEAIAARAAAEQAAARLAEELSEALRELRASRATVIEEVR